MFLENKNVFPFSLTWKSDRVPTRQIRIEMNKKNLNIFSIYVK